MCRVCTQFASTRNKGKIKKEKKNIYIYIKKKESCFFRWDFAFEKIEFEKLLDKRVFDRPFILRIFAFILLSYYTWNSIWARRYIRIYDETKSVLRLLDITLYKNYIILLPIFFFFSIIVLFHQCNIVIFF